MAKLYNLARMTTTTTGSDVITLGTAVAGRLDFETAGVSDGETISYGIVEGNNSEVGRGVYGGSGSTLTRSVLSSTNGGSPIVLTGSGHVFIPALAEDMLPEISISFTANGSAYYTSYDNMTISASVAGGIGDFSYEKALVADTTSFSAISLPEDLAIGDVLKVTVSSIDTYASVTLTRSI